jgi:hypothetical protein
MIATIRLAQGRLAPSEATRPERADSKADGCGKPA